MKPDDYIRGERRGREAHDLELGSMGDPLLADAIDGYDAVPGAPGEHADALERLAEGIARSASGGRAAARSRASRLRERRIRGWSVASAAVLLAAVAGGGVWMVRNGVRTDDSHTLADRPAGGAYRSEVVEILPPVTVIPDEENVPETAPSPMPAQTRMQSELPVVAEAMAEMMADEAPARDTTQTEVFRRHVAGRNRVRGTVTGAVTVSFEVGADGRPRDVRIVESPTPELGDFVRSLLDEGPDWPAEPPRKLITINL
ncbi:MAG: hypothetical protein LBU98_04210 [Alistipes sp.]|jgi:hypothetical protein|nr:hypothetical protein [Alistipes sp.]